MMGWGFAEQNFWTISSHQIWTKSIKWSGKYKLLKNLNVNVDADAGEVQ